MAINRIARSGSAAANDLRAAMRGKVLLPDDDAYTSARRIWNGAVNHRPAMFAVCESAEDVQASVRVARAHGLPLSVRGGGHDWAGRALSHEGLVIDLSAMRQVEIEPWSHAAIVGGGATAADVTAAAAPHGLVAATGTVGSVGMAGLTLGGGYGPLTPSVGLALDNLLGVEIVLADGRRIVADALEHPELFWALRGGGGNFGVVTAMRVHLHPLREMLVGLILFPWAEAEPVLRRYAEAARSAPDELALMAGVLSLPDGNPALFLAPFWSGEPTQGERLMVGLQQWGTPLSAQIGLMPYGDLLGLYDAHVAKGRHYAIETRWLAELTPAAISALAGIGSAKTSPLSLVAIHHFHGAAARVPLDTTAFGLRRDHFLVEIVAVWEPGAGDDGAAHRHWARVLSRSLAPAALPGGYPNLLGPDEHDRAALAYGRNLERLKAIKKQFDPLGIFASAIPLPTGP